MEPATRPSSESSHSRPFTGTTLGGVTVILLLLTEDAPYLSDTVQVTKYTPSKSGAVQIELSPKVYKDQLEHCQL